jgi:hypothetical protein
MSAATVFRARDHIVVAVIVGLLAVAVWLKVGPDFSDEVADGEVVQKREAITMPLDDTWRHEFEIAYTYQPRDQRHPRMGRHPVDAALYDRLHVGSAVKVRYRRLPLIGSAVDDSALADTWWWSRRPKESESGRELEELAAFAVAAVLGSVAYRRRSRWLAVAAGTVAITVASSVLLLGWFIFPLLFWIWRANPGKGFGWSLALSIALTTAVIYYRVPGPTALGGGPHAESKAVVRNVRVVDRIWASSSSSGESSGGQPIRYPFQMIDVEFTPQGAAEAIHALDRVDLGSLPGLKEGIVVPVTYSRAAPRSARIAGGTREFGRHALVYFLELTYGIGAALAIVMFPAVYLVLRLARRSRALRLAFDPTERTRLLSQLPADDPRREKIERLINRGRNSADSP